MQESPTSRLSADNPWPGLDFFAEADEGYFHGRDSESAELERLVRSETLTVLFGRSGLGKTSLLNAGLFPRLRPAGFVPVYIRLDFASDRPLAAQVLDALAAACTAARVEALTPSPGDSLWGHFHRKGAAFWNERNRPVVPVLVFDQFEEVFTVSQREFESRKRVADFFSELADLVENRMPEAVRQDVKANPGAADRYEIDRRGPRVVLSFRDDFLAHFEDLRRQMPSLMRNRYRLEPMNGSQAYEVVKTGGGDLVSEDVARRIVGLAWRNVSEPPPDPSGYPDMEIDPALLSVICREFNNRRLEENLSTISLNLLTSANREVLADFYERSFESLDPRVRHFVEDELLTARGHRDSFVLEDAVTRPGLSQEAIGRLVDRRLLRVDQRLGPTRIELAHDVLTRVAKDSRDSRKAREAEAEAAEREAVALAQQRRNRRFGAALLAGALAIAAAGAYVYRLKADLGVARGEAKSEKENADKAAESTRLDQARADSKTLEAKTLSKQVSDEKRRSHVLLRQAEITNLLARADQAQSTQFDLSLLLNVEAASQVSGLDAAARARPLLDARSSMLRGYQNRPHLQTFLNGHQRSVSTIAFSPDGKTLASASVDQTVILWDVVGRQALATLPGHKGAVNHVAFSPDGKTLASASDDQTVILWDVLGRKKRKELMAHTTPVNHIAFSPDGQTLASGGGNILSQGPGEVVLWDVAAQVQLTKLEGHRNTVRHIAFSPDGRTLATGGGNILSQGPGEVILWDVASSEQRSKLEGNRKPVMQLAFSPDGTTIAAGGGTPNEGGEVILWDVANGKEQAKLEGGTEFVRSIAFSPDGKTLASAGGRLDKFGEVTLWDVASRKRKATLLGHSDLVWSLAFSSDGSTLASASNDWTVKIWDVSRANELGTLRGHNDKVRDVAFFRDGKTLVSSGNDRRLILWDVSGHRSLTTLKTHGNMLTHFSFGADGKALASLNNGRELILWDMAGREKRKELKGASTLIRSVAVSADGQTVAAGGGPIPAKAPR